LDEVFPSGSDDVGMGGEGRDCIDGGGGDDLMIGGPGNDDRPCEFSAFVDPNGAMTGGPGDDRIEGGPGNDTMDGITDNDTLIGAEGNDDTSDTQPNDRDSHFGGPGEDTLSATDVDDDDLVDGGPGTDTCSADAGDTVVNCERQTGGGGNTGEGDGNPGPGGPDNSGETDGETDGGSGARRCFTPAAQARKKRIGRAGLGKRRVSVRRTFGAKGRYRHFVDRYCLSDDSTIRVGYPSHTQLRRLVRRERQRLRGKALLVLTTSRRTTVRGVNVGDTRRELLRKTGRRRGVRVGRNVWYVRRGERAGHVFKVRGGVVREVGIADRRQTATNRRVKRFFTSDR